jgi:acyl dehydratase
MSVRSKTWADIQVPGDLPVLEFPISWKTLMMQMAGNRDFFPYHHNRDFTQKLGIRDAFVNTTFYQGLFGRFATDWSGPDSDLRSMTLTMLDQLCPGDLAIVQGRAERAWRDGADHLVEISASASNAHTTTATSAIVLAMPYDKATAVARRPLSEPPQATPGISVPAAAQDEIGKQLHRTGPYPVSEAQIMYWCEMVRDANPLYADTAYARTGRNGGLIAPPQSLVIWGQPRATQMGIDPLHPDVDLPDQPAWPEAARYVPFSYRAPGATDVIVQHIACEFGTPLSPGDRVSVTYELLDCSPLKKTKLGPGYFVTGREVYRTQRGDIAGYMTMVMLQYGVPDATVRS